MASSNTPDTASGVDPAPPGRRAHRWRLRNWRLRHKLTLVFLVPAFSTLTLANLHLSEQLGDVNLLGKVRHELQLSTQVADVADAIQLERDSAVSYVAGGRDGNTTEQINRANDVDSKLTKLRGLDQITDSSDSAVRDSFRQSLLALDRLPALRNTVLTTQYPDKAALATYNEILSVLAQVHRAAASSLSSPTITPLATQMQALNNAKDQLAEQNAILLSAAKHQEFQPGLVGELRSSQSRFDAALADFNNVASLDNRQRYQDTVTGTDVDERNRLVQLALTQAESGLPVALGVVDIMQHGETSAGLLNRVLADVSGQADSSALTLIDTAQAAALRDAALVVTSLVAAFGLMAIVARSMLIPLRVLRKTALEVATTRLPEVIRQIRTAQDASATAENAVEPVPVDTTEEVGQVARAFDEVHRQAVRLALEQVALRADVNDMFVSLSRRSQGLVERQIGVIDKLEQSEQDPDQLAGLLELDHLATQMRRTSDNLLVLAGTNMARRTTRPVPIAEVIDAAVSEVEKQTRVKVAPTPEILIQGRVANDLAHLITELLDNATSFSPPSSRVTVRATETRHGELVIRIHDRGVGMQPDEIIEANKRLANPQEVDVSVAREMGLYVVAQLGNQHGIKVTLTDNDDIEGGTTGQIRIPASLLHRRDDGQPAPVATTSAAITPAFDSVRGAAYHANNSTSQPRLVDKSGTTQVTGPQNRQPGTVTHGGTAAMVPPAGAAAPQAPQTPRARPTATTEFFLPQPKVAGGLDHTSHEPPTGAAAFHPSFPPPEDRSGAARPTPVVQPSAAASLTPPGPVVSAGAENAVSTGTVRGGEPTTSLPPLYGTVQSQWFQATGKSGEPAHPVTPSVPRATEASAAPTAPVSETPMSSSRTTPEAERREPQTAAPGEDPDGVAPAARQAVVPEAEPPEPWSSTGDEGWLAAAAALTAGYETVTSVGLPKRVPKARLVPGTAGARPATQQTQQTQSVMPIHSADRTRDRFSTYQQGLRLGRDSLGGGDSIDTPQPAHGDSAQGNKDEEQT